MKILFWMIVFSITFTLIPNIYGQTELEQELQEIKSEMIKSNQNDYWLFWEAYFVGITLAGIAIIATIIYASRMKVQTQILLEQVDLQRKESELRLRPWIKITDLEPYLVNVKDGTSEARIIKWDEYWADEKKFPGKIIAIGLKFDIENIGKTPAFDVSCSIIKTSERCKRSEVLSSTETTKPHIILPGEKMSNSFVLEQEEYNKIAKEPRYFGAYVQYNTKKILKGIGKIWLFDGGRENIDSWIDGEDKLKEDE